MHFRTPRSRPARTVVALAAAFLFAVGAASAGAERPRVYAITDATLILAPGTSVDNGTIVLRDGLIEAVGVDAAVPADAEVIDGEGLIVHAGFIDAYSHLGMQPQQGGGGGGFDFSVLFSTPEAEPGTGHPIALVHPQHRVTDELIADDSEIERRREMGFTSALTAPRDGIFRGWSAHIALRDGDPRDLVISPTVAQHVGFDRGQFFGGYPSDLMGTIATIRQVHHDVTRYVAWTERYAATPAGMPRPEYNDAMEALAPLMTGEHGMVAHAGSNLMIARTVQLAEEFGARPIIVGSGNEQEMIDQIAAAGLPMIVPVDFPDEPDVSSVERLPSVSLESLQRWERAADNPAALEAAGVVFALTPYGMGNATKFAENVRKAIDAGLAADTALAAVTTVPANMLGAEDTLGSLAAGKIANVVVATGAPFGEETEIRHVFVDGIHYEMEEEEAVGDPDAVVDPRGEWAVTVTVMGQERPSTWTIEGSAGAYTGRSVSEQGEIDFESLTLEGNAMTVVLAGPMGSLEATVVIEGDTFEGSASIDAPGGQTFTLNFKGERTSGPEGGAA